MGRTVTLIRLHSQKVLSWERTGGCCQARGGDVVRVEATGLAAATPVNHSAETGQQGGEGSGNIMREEVSRREEERD